MDRLSTGRENCLARNCDVSIISLERFSSMIVFLIVIILIISPDSFPTVELRTVEVQPPPHVWFWVWTGGRTGRTDRPAGHSNFASKLVLSTSLSIL